MWIFFDQFKVSLLRKAEVASAIAFMTIIVTAAAKNSLAPLRVVIGNPIDVVIRVAMPMLMINAAILAVVLV